MCSPWLRLTKVSALPAASKRGQFSETILYELYPDDPSIRKKLPHPHPTNIIPFYHTVIVHNIPPGGDLAKKIKLLEDSFPRALKIDYFWCPGERCPEQKDNPRESVFIVCYDAEMAKGVLEFLPQVKCYAERLKGEIYVPEGERKWRGNRVYEIEAWSNVIFWAGFSGEEMVLGVGLRGLSKEGDQDLRWLANHHFHYVPSPLEGKNEVTVWLSSIEKDWKPVSKVSETSKIKHVTRPIVSAIKNRMYCNKVGVGLKLVFEKEDQAEYFKLWLTEKAVGLVPKYKRVAEKGRWYIYKYA